jgi:hypothetical protein
VDGWLARATSAICVNSHTQSPTTRHPTTTTPSHRHDYDHDSDDTHDSDFAKYPYHCRRATRHTTPAPGLGPDLHESLAFVY